MTSFSNVRTAVMKKLNLTFFSLFFLVAVLKSQTPTTTVVYDTLHYYYNKYYFKSNIAKISGPITGTVSASNTAVLASPAQFYSSPASTYTGSLLLGCKFENSEPLEITGLEAVISQGNSLFGILKVEARIYLCLLDNAGNPIMPPKDSVRIYTNSKQVRVWGADFIKPHIVTGNFAIMVRNASSNAGDTIKIYHSPCITHTAYTSGPIQYRYSDGYGIIRHNGTFYPATNYTVTPGFGIGTDYEFFVAPRVTYTLNVQQTLPTKVANSETLCTSVPVIFSNSSSSRLTNRMYNLLETYRKWSQPYAPMPNGPTSGWPADSAVSWKFDFEDNGSAQGGRLFLPYASTNNSISFQTDSVLKPLCSNQNYFRASLKKMGLYGQGELLKYWESMVMCVDYCNGDNVGLTHTNGLESLSIFPNPALTGTINIVGLNGKNTIYLYDVLGQLVYKTSSNHDECTIDISAHQNGSYVIKVENEYGQSIRHKIIKNN
jgi:hypothetical protein